MNFVLVVYTAVALSFPGGNHSHEKDYVYRFSGLEQCTVALMAITAHSNPPVRAECLEGARYKSELKKRKLVVVHEAN